MKLTNKETGASKHLRRSVATRRFKACNECALKCEEECEKWINDSGKSAPSICAGLGIILVEESEEDISQVHCEYCDDEKSKVITTVEIPYYPDAEISIFQGKLTGGVCDVRVNYCPMCGRKL